MKSKNELNQLAAEAVKNCAHTGEMNGVACLNCIKDAIEKATEGITRQRDDEQAGEIANIHIEHYFPKGYNPDEEPWKSIKVFHNSATEKAWQDGYDANPRAEFERKWNIIKTKFPEPTQSRAARVGGIDNRQWIADHLHEINPATDFDAKGNLIRKPDSASTERDEQLAIRMGRALRSIAERAGLKITDDVESSWRDSILYHIIPPFGVGQEWTVEFTDSDRPILNRHDGTPPVTYPKEFTQAVKETVDAHNATLHGEDTKRLDWLLTEEGAEWFFYEYKAGRKISDSSIDAAMKEQR